MNRSLSKIVIAVLSMCVISCSNDNNDNENEPDSIFTVQQTSSGSHEGYEYVDLGLSVKWAICNVGDSLPYGYGDYYAWGETETKDTFSLKAYHYAGDPNKLPDSCDVARQKMGGNWRMPTKAEFEELLKECKWSCTKYPKTDVYGYKVTAKNKNWMFIPLSGHKVDEYTYDTGKTGILWSSDADQIYPYVLTIYFSGNNDKNQVQRTYPFWGLPVRAVIKE